MTSGCSFLPLSELLDIDRVRLLVFDRSLASGWVDKSSDLTDMSSAELFTSELSEALDNFLLSLKAPVFAAEGFAQSGTGYSRSNWRRSRSLYSLPLTRSSDSVFLSFLSLALEARETTTRSSSLSSHAAPLSLSDSIEPSSSLDLGKRSGMFTTDGLESSRNSWKNFERKEVQGVVQLYKHQHRQGLPDFPLPSRLGVLAGQQPRSFE